MTKLKVEVVSPDKEIINEEVDSLTIPTKTGEVTILPGHSQFISALGHGAMEVRNNSKQETYTILGGFMQVQEGSKVLIMADASEHVTEIDEKKAEEAKKRAEALLDEVRDDHERFAEVEAELLRSITRLSIAKKHKTRHKIDIN